MSFFDILEKIQRKPESARKKIMAISVIIIMFLIIFLWLNNLKFSLNDKEEEKTPGPFKILKESVSKGMETLKNEIR